MTIRKNELRRQKAEKEACKGICTEALESGLIEYITIFLEQACNQKLFSKGDSDAVKSILSKLKGGEMKEDLKLPEGGPAFPIIAEEAASLYSKGMSLRAWFMGQAIAAGRTIANDLKGLTREQVADVIADDCALIADACLRRLEK